MQLISDAIAVSMAACCDASCYRKLGIRKWKATLSSGFSLHCWDSRKGSYGITWTSLAWKGIGCKIKLELTCWGCKDAPWGCDVRNRIKKYVWLCAAEIYTSRALAPSPGWRGWLITCSSSVDIYYCRGEMWLGSKAGITVWVLFNGKVDLRR